MSLYLLDTFKFPAYGEITFECSENEYLWQVPAGITSISAVLIGGGGAGAAGGNQTQRAGGGGGGLRYINSMVVVPGETLRIKAGCGGTGQSLNPGPTGFGANNTYKLTEPGVDSYIASDNNANVPARTGIGDTIIVFAQGGGQTPAPTAANIAASWYVAFSANSTQATATESIQYEGGSGTTPGSYSFGTIGGGNGGDGGQGTGGNGGGMDGGGGGAAGWVNGTTGGSGGYFTGNNAASYVNPTDGAAGGGGGGGTSDTGGSFGAGGGGGTGMRWGIGPNGQDGNFNSDGSTAEQAIGQPGQGGSWGRDGKATGNDLISYAAYFGADPHPSNYPNGSDGNGLRGFVNSYDGIPEGEVPANEREGSGGYYGGGGGGAQSSGSGGGFSGFGGDGVVRIIYAARIKPSDYGQDPGPGQDQGITRLYPGDYDPSLTLAQNQAAGWPDETNLLTSFGYPNIPPAAGGTEDFFGP